MTAPVPEPEAEGSPWFQQLVRDGEIRPMTVESFPDLFESDEEAEAFREWLYRTRRGGLRA